MQLPLVMKESPLLETIFGVEMDAITPTGGLQQVKAAGTTWVRRNGVLWHNVEPVQGARNWNALANLDAELINARQNGLQVILIVRGTPDWAQAVPPYTCGPIRPDKRTAFANFMFDLVSRYSAPPFEVKYWELWNEPDVSPGQIPTPTSSFGCWGDESDPQFFGGSAYADMLAAAYPMIKAADPQAQVLVGGLLLYCNPTQPATCSDPAVGDLPTRFLEGILDHHGAGDGGDFFDGVSFHAYDFYLQAEGQFENENWGTGWDSTGPVGSAKAAFIASVLAAYNANDKVLINTESALLCETCLDDPDFEITKAYYVAQTYASALNADMQANIWFSLLGWRNSGLLNPDLTPKPAYSAYQFARRALQNATSRGEITSGDISGAAGVKGYKFDRHDRQVWVLWSLDGGDHGVTLLPGPPTAAYDVLGNTLSLTPTATLTVTLAPQYLEWQP